MSKEEVVTGSMWCYSELDDRVEVIFVKEVIESSKAVGYASAEGDVVVYWLAGDQIGFECSDSMEDFLAFYTPCQIVPVAKIPDKAQD
jgi:hypothetical protein